jgi:predicted  nucleic acid-binding Zn-ribbon protein
MPEEDKDSTQQDATQLLDLQRADTDADQLRIERQRSPLRDDLAAETNLLEQWESRRSELRTRIDQLTASIEKAETDGADLTTHRQRLESQMKTVIAPREAEALMHEIATIDGQRDEIDIAELEALEEQSALDDELVSHLERAETVLDRVRIAEQALADAVAEIDQQLTNLETQRSDIRMEISDSLLTTYDRVRDALGVAVAKLQGKQCLGCHIALSAAEVDTAKDDAASVGIADCPQCGRMLIV